MSCNTYVHNDPTGGSKYISGTTCSGTEVYYTLTIGQSVCFNDDLPLINECGLVISGSCYAVTPTPTTTPYEYCYVSALTYNTVAFSCDNGSSVFNVYGVFKFYASVNGVIVSSHPDLSFVLTNGTNFETVVIPNGQEYTEFVFPKILHNACATGDCVPTIFPNWTIYTPPTTQCPLVTPTPTPTPTANPVCPEELQFYYTGQTGEYSAFTGTYVRTYSYTGGTFVGGYMNYDTPSGIYTFISGADPIGNIGAIYTRFASGFYYTMIAFSNNGGNMFAYAIFETNTNYVFNGQQPLPFAIGLDQIVNSPSIGNLYFPRQGDNDPTNPELKLITYPVICPTTTPTSSNAPTPTPTPTNTKTPTQTPSATPMVNPINIPNLFYWFDTSDESTLTFNDVGGIKYVSQIRDKVTGQTLTQSAQTYQPIWKYNENISSLRSLELGSSRYMVGFPPRNTVAQNTPKTIFAVYASGNTQYNIQQFYLDIRSSGSGAGAAYSLLNSSTNKPQSVTNQKNIILTSYSSTSASGTNPKLLIGYSSSPDRDQGAYFEMNDVSVTQANSSSGLIGFLNIMYMGRGISGSYAQQGAFCELLWYDRILSASEIDNVLRYLNERWFYNPSFTPTPTSTLTNTPSNTPTQTQTPTTTTTLTATNTSTPTNTATRTQTPTPTRTPSYRLYTVQTWTQSGGSCSQTGGNFSIKSTATLVVGRYYCTGVGCNDRYKVISFDGMGNPGYPGFEPISGDVGNANCTFLICCP
jgi:hypothetical protein